MRKNMFRKYILLLAAILGLFCMTGCGNKEEITSFQQNMDNFYTEVSEIESNIEAIDAEDDGAVTNLLIYLEQMSSQFQQLAQMEIPKEFVNIEALTSDASEYMTEAVRLYTEAYGTDSVNDAYVEAAAKNYASAMKRINYIAVLLQGEIPEGVTVIEGDDTEFEPYTQQQ